MFKGIGEYRPATSEEIVEPDLPILDAHHHLWPAGAKIPYGIADLRRDVGTAHNVLGTVFVESMAAYRQDGDEALRPIGETEFVLRECPSVRAKRGDPQFAAGIVAWADLRNPPVASRTLDGHIAVGRGRLKGVRHNALWHVNSALVGARVFPRYLMLDGTFQDGLREVAKRGLTYDVWLFHEQLDDVASAADAVPELTFVVDHFGGPVTDLATPEGRKAVFDAWRKALANLARRPNVYLKVGGLGMPVFGFAFEQRVSAPGARELAAAWKPYVEVAIDAFGPDRCIFESNFPIDRISCSYDSYWSALKLTLAGYTYEEKVKVLFRNACRVYGIDLKS